MICHFQKKKAKILVLKRWDYSHFFPQKNSQLAAYVRYLEKKSVLWCKKRKKMKNGSTSWVGSSPGRITAYNLGSNGRVSISYDGHCKTSTKSVFWTETPLPWPGTCVTICWSQSLWVPLSAHCIWNSSFAQWNLFNRRRGGFPTPRQPIAWWEGHFFVW